MIRNSTSRQLAKYLILEFGKSKKEESLDTLFNPITESLKRIASQQQHQQFAQVQVEKTEEEGHEMIEPKVFLLKFSTCCIF